MATARTSLRLTAAIAALGLALTACADDDPADVDDDTLVVDDEDDTVVVDEADGTTLVEGDEDAEEDLAAAVERSLAAGPTRARFESRVTTPQREAVVVGEGVTDGADAVVDMVISGGLADAVGDGEAELEIRIVDGIAYQRFPALFAQADVDAEWLQLDVDDLGAEFEPYVDSAHQADAARVLRILDDVRAARVVGQETIDGATTTTYQATVDIAAVFDVAGANADLLAASGIGADLSVPVQVWVDEDGLVRRVLATVEDDGVTATMQFDVLERDVAVDVDRPDPDVTISFEEFVRARG